MVKSTQISYPHTRKNIKYNENKMKIDETGCAEKVQYLNILILVCVPCIIGKKHANTSDLCAVLLIIY